MFHVERGWGICIVYGSSTCSFLVALSMASLLNLEFFDRSDECWPSKFSILAVCLLQGAMRNGSGGGWVYLSLLGVKKAVFHVKHCFLILLPINGVALLLMQPCNVQRK